MSKLDLRKTLNILYKWHSQVHADVCYEEKSEHCVQVAQKGQIDLITGVNIMYCWVSKIS